MNILIILGIVLIIVGFYFGVIQNNLRLVDKVTVGAIISGIGGAIVVITLGVCSKIGC